MVSQLDRSKLQFIGFCSQAQSDELSIDSEAALNETVEVCHTDFEFHSNVNLVMNITTRWKGSILGKKSKIIF